MQRSLPLRDNTLGCENEWQDGGKVGKAGKGRSMNEWVDYKFMDGQMGGQIWMEK